MDCTVCGTCNTPRTILTGTVSFSGSLTVVFTDFECKVLHISAAARVPLFGGNLQ